MKQLALPIDLGRKNTLLNRIIDGYKWSQIFIWLMLGALLLQYLMKPKLSDYVEPAMYGDNIIATTFIVQYDHKRFTVTNRHVCEAYKDSIINVNGRFERIIKIAQHTDLCLVTYTGKMRSGLLINNNKLDNLDELVQYGFAGGDAKEKSTGVFRGYGSQFFSWIHNVNEETDPMEILLFALGLPTKSYPKVEYGLMYLTCKGGCSGSPILHNGEVAGVLFAGDRTYYKDTLMIPSHVLVEFIKDNIGLL